MKQLGSYFFFFCLVPFTYLNLSLKMIKKHQQQMEMQYERSHKGAELLGGRGEAEKGFRLRFGKISPGIKIHWQLCISVKKMKKKNGNDYLLALWTIGTKYLFYVWWLSSGFKRSSNNITGDSWSQAQIWKNSFKCVFLKEHWLFHPPEHRIFFPCNHPVEQSLKNQAGNTTVPGSK